jgi:hypothetical protein
MTKHIRWHPQIDAGVLYEVMENHRRKEDYEKLRQKTQEISWDKFDIPDVFDVTTVGNLFLHFTTVSFAQLHGLFHHIFFTVYRAIENNSLAISTLLVVEKAEAGPEPRLQLQ